MIYGDGDIDLENFIQVQKQKLQKEKEEITFQNEGAYGQRTSGNFHREPVMTQDPELIGGLQFGGYEDKQKKLREERSLEYKKFLAEKDFRSKGKVSPLLEAHQNRGYDTKPAEKLFQTREDRSRQALSTPDLYEELLNRKRREEKRYRESYEEPEINSSRRVQFEDERREPGHSREVTFDLEDDDLFEWAKQRSKGKRGQSAKESGKQSWNNSTENDNRAKSVPPEPKDFVIGGSNNNAARQQKQAEYKRDLEEQIRQKEQEKLKEKLKRMGRITSSTDIGKVESKATAPKETEEDNENEAIPVQKTKPKRARNKWRERPDDYIPDAYHDRMRMQNYPPYDPYMAMMYGAYPGPRAPPIDRFRGDPYVMQRGYAGYESGPYYSRASDYEDGRPRLDDDDDYYRGTRERRRSRGRDRSSERERIGTPDAKSSEKQSKEKSPSGNIFGQSGDGPGKDETRAKQMAYHEELKKQMKEKEMAKKREKEETDKYNAKIEAQIMEYNPWGKGGGGAPIKNDQGHIVTDLRTMRQYNQEGKVISPRENSDLKDTQPQATEDKQSPLMAALEQQGLSSLSPRIALDGSLNKSSPYARGAALKELQGIGQDSAQKSQQDEYREYLRLQVEEKNKKKKEEQDKLRAEEEKENRRLEEQRKKIEQEYLEEQERQRKKEEEVRRKNDELRKAAEDKRLEEEKRRRDQEEERHQYLLRRSLDRKSLEGMLRSGRPSSPPIPALKTQGRAGPSPPVPALGRNNQERAAPSPPVPALARNNQTTANVRSESPPVPAVVKQQHIERRPSPPVPAVMKQQTTQHTTEIQRENSISQQEEQYQSHRAQQNNNVFSFRNTRTEHQTTENTDMSYLNSIRDNIYNVTSGAHQNDVDVVEQQHVLTQLKLLRNQLVSEERKLEVNIELSKEKYRELKRKGSDRKQIGSGAEIFDRARMKKISHSRKQESHAAEDFQKITERSSILDFKGNKDSSPDLDSKQREFIRHQEEKLIALRELLDKSARNLKVESQKLDEIRASKTSLLESDSKFIGVDFESDSTSINRSRPSSRQLSSDARPSSRTKRAERRNSSLRNTPEPGPSTLAKPQTPGGVSSQSAATLAIEEIAARNEERLRQLKLKEQQEQANDPAEEDPNNVLNDYLNKQPSH